MKTYLEFMSGKSLRVFGMPQICASDMVDLAIVKDKCTEIVLAVTRIKSHRMTFLWSRNTILL